MDYYIFIEFLLVCMIFEIMIKDKEVLKHKSTYVTWACNMMFLPYYTME